jgi:hypothetical protein
MTQSAGSAPFAFTASGALGPAPGTGGYTYFTGISLRETGGSSTVNVTVRGNGVVTGPIVGEFSAQSGQAFPAAILPDVRIPGQAYVQVTGSGTVSGVIYLR